MAEMVRGDASTPKTVRIYIGGLGENVTAEDLKKTFSTAQLGKVESMDIVRTKGRSFAYLDLLPSSDKSLPKLFSTYNGCMWKGGKLRIEKWEEDATLSTTSTHLPVTAAEKANSLISQKKGSKLDEGEIRIYFPKLRKIKSVSLRGTGKHKYSFQRVEAPPLPSHFCDCEEHSGPHTAKQNSLCNYDSKDGGMDDKELNIMNSVLNRILERENYSEQAPRSKKLRRSNGTVDHFQNDKNLVNQEMGDDDNLILNVVAGSNDRTIMVKDPFQEAMTATQVNEDFVDQEMDDDDDNLIINVVASANDKTTMFKEPTLEAIAAIQNSLSKKSLVATDKQKQGRKTSSNRKRKAPSEDEDSEAHNLLSKPEAKQSLDALICDRTDVCPTEVKPGSLPSNRSARFAKKSPWKNLVSASSGATFSVLDILPSAIPVKETESDTDGVSESYFSDKTDEVSNNEKVSDQHEELDKVESEDEKVSDQQEEPDNVELEDEVSKDEKVSNKHEEPDKVAEDPTEKLDSPVDIYVRGAAWRQKSSWTELVRDATRSSFSISQILPGPSLPKPEKKSDNTGKSDSQDVSKSHEGTKTVSLGTCSGSIFIVEQNNAHFSKELPMEQKGKMKNEAGGPTPEKEHLSAPKQGDTNYRETCSFMKSAASIKEWTKTKAALSGSLKKKSNEKK
ncbi:unnamed protein product [Withania somnifera]